MTFPKCIEMELSKFCKTNATSDHVKISTRCALYYVYVMFPASCLSVIWLILKEIFDRRKIKKMLSREIIIFRTK